jgi:glycosyltransferase involved in cell wall biosynthesis
VNVSVVCTTLNEEATIGPLLTALSRQTLPPNEIILVDGGSEDATVLRARSFQSRMPALQIVLAPGSNISAGRNRGIAASTSPIIVLTDAGCVPEPEWIEALVAALERCQYPGFVSGVVIPDTDTHLASCIAQCSLSFRIKLGTAQFLPTARSMGFHRELWSSSGGFPEAMDYGEDAAFVLAVRGRGATIEVANDARVRWQPRPTYRSVATQFYHYADGLAQGGLSNVFHRRTLAQDLGGLLCVALGLLWNHPLPWGLLALLAGLYGIRKAREGCFSVPSWRTFYRVPLVLLTIHGGTLAGIIHGNAVRRLRSRREAVPAP